MFNNLFFYNTAFGVGALLSIILPIIVLSLKKNKLSSEIVLFSLLSWSIAVFDVTQLFGAHAPTAYISGVFFTGNLVYLFVSVFTAHWILTLLGKDKDHTERVLLYWVYIIGGVILASCIVFRDMLLGDSISQGYLAWYYNPGILFYVMVGWAVLVQLFYFVKLAWAYRVIDEPIQKNRYRYVLLATLGFYLTGQAAFILALYRDIDPVWTGLMSIFPIAIMYTVLRYQLMEVRTMFRRAWMYISLVAVLVAFIWFSNFLNTLIGNLVPGFPVLLVPIALSLIGVIVGVSFWNKLRMGDHLKYEFVTIVAHKFRTPLTHIKWTTETLIANETNKSKKEDLEAMKISSEKLISLTGTLVNLARADASNDSLYEFKRHQLAPILSGAVEAFKTNYEQKEIALRLNLPDEEVLINADDERIRFVVQTFLENALRYTQKGGSVVVSTIVSPRSVKVLVSDTGIGINRSDIKLVFSKFYRTHNAKSKDSEGFGVGLFLASSVVKRHGGKVEVVSDGEGKGSVFSFTLPRIG
ncbi:MAG: hypothetical protein RIT04_172 [Candidatus Parcubacteria bacterium]|jgi:signal transduction histidine kinase